MASELLLFISAPNPLIIPPIYNSIFLIVNNTCKLIFPTAALRYYKHGKQPFINFIKYCM